MKTEEVFLKHVVPVLGTVIAIGMYASPLKAVFRVRRSKILGELNPIPYPLAYANAASWVAYSMVVRDGYVFAPNGVGVLLALFNTLSTIPYARCKVQNWMAFIVTAEAGLIMFLGAGTVIPGVEHAKLKLIWGITAIVVQMFYYSSPLTTLHHVIVNKDSSTLHWPLCLSNFLCAALWFIYGLAIQDWFIGGPNGMGAIFSLVSLLLCFVFPRKAVALMNGCAEAGAPATAAGAGAAGAAAWAANGATAVATPKAAKDVEDPPAAGIAAKGPQKDVQDV